LYRSSPTRSQARIGKLRERSRGDAKFRESPGIASDDIVCLHQDKLAARTIGQPELPNWRAKRIIGLVLTAKGQTATDARNMLSSAGVAVIVVNHDDKVASVEAGWACERFALQAAALDVRIAFVNQPIEVRSLRPRLASLGCLQSTYGAERHEVSSDNQCVYAHRLLGHAQHSAAGD